ncbi:MAG: excisionase family DNA-binding protein [Planctomycetes bacterium]|nr:excisionase family DNA-binding protein [Planctomycetota bacterium]
MTETLHQERVYTTGEVAAICNVAARTVSKWIDCGRLEGYRIPGSRDRRVTRETLERFMRAHGLPLTGFTQSTGEGTLLIVDSDPNTSKILRDVIAQETKRDAVVVRSAFEAGVICERSRPSSIIVDCNIGVNEAAGLASWLRAEKRNSRVVATGESMTAGDEATLIRAGVSAIVPKPCTVRAILTAVDDHWSQAS